MVAKVCAGRRFVCIGKNVWKKRKNMADFGFRFFFWWLLGGSC